jgi:hypothetical protein
VNQQPAKPRVSRKARRAARQKRRDQMRAKRRAAAIAEASATEDAIRKSYEITDDPLEFIEKFVRVKHWETKEPVCPLEDITREFVRNMSSFRMDENGLRVSGSDIACKPRKVFLTSVVYGLIVWAMLRFKHLRCISTMQVGRRDTLEPMRKRFRYIIAELPDEYREGWSEVGGEITSPTGCTWTIMSAGSSESIADKIGRGDDIDIFHESETSFYPEPEALASAAKEAMPLGSSWWISESTMPSDREQWQAAEYFRSKKGLGVLLKAHFWPWYAHKVKRYAIGSSEYESTMCPDFEALMLKKWPNELAKEIELGLDDEQKAYRRFKYLRGSSRDRRKARRENPEHDEMPFESPDNTAFDPDALEALDSFTQKTSYFRQHGGRTEMLWLPKDYDGHVVVGVDNWEGGRDYQSAVFLDWETGDQIGQIHGKGLDSAFAESIASVLRMITKSGKDPAPRHRYTLAIERNRGRGLGPECEKRDLRLWCDSLTKTARWGVITGGHNRGIYFDRISELIEGPDTDEDGRARVPYPVAAVRSTMLIAQLKKTVVEDNRHDVTEGHDDAMMAYGIAAYTRAKVKPSRGFAWKPPAPSGPAGISERSGGMS